MDLSKNIFKPWLHRNKKKIGKVMEMKHCVFNTFFILYILFICCPIANRCFGLNFNFTFLDK